jgi:hypothetical protein
MSSFLDWFLRRKPAVVVPPDIAPVTPIPPPAPTAAGTIQIEDYSRALRRWLLMDVPFRSSAELAVKKIGSGYTFAKVRVTVLSGQLTVTGTSCNGPHKPSINSLDKIYLSGESFVVECKLGPKTVNNPGHHDQVNWGVRTKELGDIIQLSAVITYT